MGYRVVELNEVVVLVILLTELIACSYEMQKEGVYFFFPLRLQF